MTTPNGYGWKVVPTADGFDVVDAYTLATAATADTRHDAWVAVAALSKARYAPVGAVVVDKTYSAGTPYSTVECWDCLVALNSGHHYPANARHFAVALADAHNKEVHAA